MFQLFGKMRKREESGGRKGRPTPAPADAARQHEAVPDDSLAVLRETFNMFDKNQDGIITAAELGEVMASLGQDPTPQELDDIINEFDLNQDGSLDFDEFRVMMESRAATENDVEEEGREAFKVFDKDGDGFITREELRNGMARMEEHLTERELDAMMREADTNGDGMINYEEFLAKLLGR